MNTMQMQDPATYERSTEAEISFLTPELMVGHLRLHAAIRPPLVSEWESERVLQFRSGGQLGRRAAWMAGRSLLKNMLNSDARYKGPQIADIREDERGLIELHQWGKIHPSLHAEVLTRGERIVAAISDRRVGAGICALDAPIKAQTRTHAAIARGFINATGAHGPIIEAIIEAASRAGSCARSAIVLKKPLLQRGVFIEAAGVDMELIQLRIGDGYAVAVVERRADEPWRHAARMTVTPDAKRLLSPRQRKRLEQ